MSLRKEFEEWRRATAKMDPGDAVALDGFGDNYAHRTTQAMWLAWRASRRSLATPAQQQPVNEWQHAIDDELVCCHLGTTETFPDPREALRQIINWHVAVALDPAVSSAAQALIDRGAQQPVSAEAVLRKIADLKPILQESTHGPRWRCLACGYAWVDGKEKEQHSENCAYAIAIAALTPPQAPGGAA